MARLLLVGGVLVVTAFLALAPGTYSPLAPLADDWLPALDHRHLVAIAAERRNDHKGRLRSCFQPLSLMNCDVFCRGWPPGTTFPGSKAMTWSTFTLDMAGFMPQLD